MSLEKVIKLADIVGVKLESRRLNRTHCWNGKNIALLEYNGNLRPYSNLIHDITHYLVAAKRRRRMPEFGLGTSPDDFCARAACVVSDEAAANEEREASLLGIFIERQFGLDWELTWDDHGWNDYKNLTATTMLRQWKNYTKTPLPDTIRRLMKKQLLDENLKSPYAQMVRH